MIRNTIQKATISSSLFSIFGNDYDIVSKDTKTAQEIDIASVIKQETGWERLQQLFRRDQFGRISPEVQTVLNIAFMSSFIGGLYGGFIHSREAYIDFIKNNQATSFRDHIDAKRKLQDQVSVNFAKGAFRWGWRLTSFSTIYITVMTGLSTYWGRYGILEHSIAGFTAGSLYKFKLGPRASLVGGGLGLVLGTFAGVITSTLLSITGMSMEEIRYWNYKWMQSRTDAVNKGMKEHLEKEQIRILTEHEHRLTNTSLDGLDSNKIDASKTK